MAPPTHCNMCLKCYTWIGHSLSCVTSRNMAWAILGTRGLRLGWRKAPTGSPPYRYTSLPSSWLSPALIASATAKRVKLCKVRMLNEFNMCYLLLAKRKTLPVFIYSCLRKPVWLSFFKIQYYTQMCNT